MAAIILAWKPGIRDGWQPAYPDAVEHVAEAGTFAARWSVGQRRNIPAGTEAWLLLQGRHARGLVGHATVTAEPYSGAGLAAPDDAVNFVDLAVDALLPRGEGIPVDELLARVPGVPWKAVRSSGTVLKAEHEPALRALWAENVLPSGPDPTLPVPGTLPGPAVERVLANRYERDLQARHACMEHHGTSCSACGFNFEAVYGELGHGFIHVHHVVPAALLGPAYELDPITDLVPLCANCHAMAHARADLVSPGELRRILGTSRSVLGDVASPEQEAAWDDARRILEQR
ncbi:HNH endonuclease [Arthrobacter mobilis]|uniref:Restriction endonuclease n=1 Tax=Arthrobacter mobilis TaxID=2724944 RepID=A0A7X6HFR2_9MICC|nr:HNH endonuclease [Arthrobacter mobilis]NKX56322.1 restriction endonuclease [Arthrobacter mobilis]